MSDEQGDPLDRALSTLARDVAPPRDLWPAIAVQIERTPRELPLSLAREPLPLLWQLAAGVLLVVASSLTTYLLMRSDTQPQTIAARGAASMMPASFGGQEALAADYRAARAALGKVFEQRIAQLPPVARAKLQRDLADLRRAASEISATLAQYPSDPLLQELLLSTYQRELQLLADVNEMTRAADTRT